jgi:hypothetical protein
VREIQKVGRMERPRAHEPLKIVVEKVGGYSGAIDKGGRREDDHGCDDAMLASHGSLCSILAHEPLDRIK